MPASHPQKKEILQRPQFLVLLDFLVAGTVVSASPEFSASTFFFLGFPPFAFMAFMGMGFPVLGLPFPFLGLFGLAPLGFFAGACLLPGFRASLCRVLRKDYIE